MTAFDGVQLISLEFQKEGDETTRVAFGRCYCLTRPSVKCYHSHLITLPPSASWIDCLFPQTWRRVEGGGRAVVAGWLFFLLLFFCPLPSARWFIGRLSLDWQPYGRIWQQDDEWCWVMNQSVSKRYFFFSPFLSTWKMDELVEKAAAAHRGHVRRRRQRLCWLYYRN